MVTLTANIDADDPVITVTGTVPEGVGSGFTFAIDTEVLRFREFQGVLPPYPYPVNRQSWRVERGVDGSVAASHTAGATLYAVREAWARSSDLTSPGPFPTVVTPTAVSLSDTDATEAQFSEVLDTRGGKSLGLLTKVSGSGSDSVDVLLLHRQSDTPWAPAPAIEAAIIGAGASGPILSHSTIWPSNGTSGNGGPLPSTWADHWPGLLDESVIVVQPRDPNGGVAASVTTEMGSLTNQVWSITNATPGDPDTGEFTLTFRGQTTDPMSAFALTSQVVSALEGLSSIGSGNVQAAAGFEANDIPSGVGFEFIGTLTGLAVEAPTITNDTVGGGWVTNEEQAGGELGTPTPDANLVFSAFVNGDWGNALSVQFVDPGEPEHSLEITSEDGYLLTITLETDGMGELVTQANDLLSVLGSFALAPSPWAITVDLAPENDGGGVLNATGVLPLVGGDGGATAVSYSVTGSL